MPDPVESTLEVDLEIMGQRLNRIKRWQIDADYMMSTDGFSFTTYDSDIDVVRWLEMQPVTLYVAGQPQLTGRIDASTTGEDGVAISYEGRDYIADLVESHIDPSVEVKEGISLAELVKLVAGPVGITDVVGDEQVPLRNVRTGQTIRGGQPKNFTAFKMKELQPQKWNQGIYDYLNRVMARHGCTIQPGTDRKRIRLTAPDYTQSPSYRLIRRRGDQVANNNIIKGTARRDYSSVPTHVLFNGTQARSGTNGAAVSTYADVGNVSAASVKAAVSSGIAGNFGSFGASLYALTSSALSEALPERRPSTSSTLSRDVGSLGQESGGTALMANTIQAAAASGRRRPNSGPLENGRLYRLLAQRDTESRTLEQLDRVAARAISERLKNALVYRVTVQGHIEPESGAIWSIDTIVDVRDEVAGVYGPMWIAKRTMKFDSTGGGATTDLVCWTPNIFLPG